jgi:AcrR family transcriptional regulator
MGVLPPEVAHRIAEASGYGVGSLYEYFPNKESLVAASTYATAEVLQEYGGL